VVVKPLLALGAEVFVFGSRARGDSQPFSDLDLMIEAETDLSKIVFQVIV
jgi:predicted nucleotidyltransferase